MFQSRIMTGVHQLLFSSSILIGGGGGETLKYLVIAGGGGGGGHGGAGGGAGGYRHAGPSSEKTGGGGPVERSFLQLRVLQLLLLLEMEEVAVQTLRAVKEETPPYHLLNLQ